MFINHYNLIWILLIWATEFFRRDSDPYMSPMGYDPFNLVSKQPNCKYLFLTC
jgi:hypothetical protein